MDLTVVVFQSDWICPHAGLNYLNIRVGDEVWFYYFKDFQSPMQGNYVVIFISANQYF